MNKVCIYLRKSRADEDLERTIGEGETLRKHKDTLLKYAREKNLNIIDIKEEIVSGDSLFFRPKMLELLKEVEAKHYDGVLVMDIDRLGRGGMKDQGIILEAFKESNTLIMTPGKTYDLTNEYDEEMTEFKTFFARRELKSITKRMQGGRTRSVESGNYLGTNPPLGYDLYFIGKNRTLKINDYEAQIIKIIFEMYSKSNGATAIANHLNNLGFKTKTNRPFHQSSILVIIKNPIYIGKVTWKKIEDKKSKIPGKKSDTRTRDKSEWIIAEGKHEAIISDDLFNKCQDILNGRYHIPYQLTNRPINPLSGLITCGICGKKMTMRPLRGVYRLMCNNKCGNTSAKFELVENELINALFKYIENYKLNISNKSNNINVDLLKNQEISINKELTTLKEQKNKLFDFLERGIYTEDVFLERSKNLDIRIKDTKDKLNSISNELIKASSPNSISDVIYLENAIKAYIHSKDVTKKNSILKAVLYKIDFYKEKGNKPDDFKLTIFPKLLR